MAAADTGTKKVKTNTRSKTVKFDPKKIGSKIGKINNKKFTLASNYQNSTDPVREDLKAYWESPRGILTLSETYENYDDEILKSLSSKLKYKYEYEIISSIEIDLDKIDTSSESTSSDRDFISIRKYKESIILQIKDPSDSLSGRVPFPSSEKEESLLKCYEWKRVS